MHMERHERGIHAFRSGAGAASVADVRFRCALRAPRRGRAFGDGFPLPPPAGFLASVLETAAEDGTSVLFSSHVVAELERAADYLVVLTGGRVQVAGDVETLLAGHQILTGPADGAGTVGGQFDVVHAQRGLAQAHLLVRRRTAAAQPPAGWQVHPATLEELMLGYLREPEASALPGPEPLAAEVIS
jgi:ABC-2 type transport system ATP-binding protein